MGRSLPASPRFDFLPRIFLLNAPLIKNPCAGDKDKSQGQRRQIPELLAVKSIQYVGPLPPEFQNFTVFSADVLTGARKAEAAKALLDLLTTPAAARVFKAKGMEP